MDDFDDDGGMGLPDDDLTGGPELGDLDEDGEDAELDLEAGDEPAAPRPRAASPAMPESRASHTANANIPRNSFTHCSPHSS